MSAAATSSHPRLLADVGGTHARFGWVDAPGGRIDWIRQYRCSDHASLESIVAFYLADQRRPVPRAAAIGIATTVDADRVTMTNLPWSFSIEAMRERFALDRLVVLNDFAALADLTSGQKMLVRMGPAAQRRLKARLVEFRRLVAGGAATR